MMTRRVLLGAGAVVAGGAAALGAAKITHRLDDAARWVGLEPKPEPDPRDAQIVRAAARDQATVTAAAQALHDAQPSAALALVAAACGEQLRAVGGTPVAARTPPASVGDLATLLAAASRRRADQAGEAFSPELVRVLASMSAGLAQCERRVRQLA